LSDCREREIAIANQEARRVVTREGLSQLLRRPRRGRMRGDSDVDHAPLMAREHDEDEQQPEGGGRDDETRDDQGSLWFCEVDAGLFRTSQGLSYVASSSMRFQNTIDGMRLPDSHWRSGPCWRPGLIDRDPEPTR
jgi:hypothetical protein